MTSTQANHNIQPMETDSPPSALAHTLSFEEVCEHHHVDPTRGLTSDAAAQLLSSHGKNAFDTKGGVKWYTIFAYHAFNFMNLVLLVAMALSFVVLAYIDAGVVIFVIIINTLIGFRQEYKSEKTMEALRNMSTPTCRVLRDGETKEIESTELVPGDIILVKEGDSIPADARVVRVNGLETDEAILTGETVPVTKKLDAITEPDTPLGDRKNIVYMGTNVSKGKGRAVVVATGNDTEMGKIASTLNKAKKTRTPLQKRLDRLGVILSGLAVLFIAIVLLTGWAWGTWAVYPEGLRVAVSVAVAIIPQSVVVVVTLTLTVGVRTMAERHALVRKLNAVETLGNITNICTDKTGTLTQGKMVATSVAIPFKGVYRVEGEGLEPHGAIKDSEGNEIEKESHEILIRAITIAALCNTSQLVEGSEEEASSSQEKAKEEGKGKKKEKSSRSPAPKEAAQTHDAQQPNEGAPAPGWRGVGSPTEVALVVLGHKIGVSRADSRDEWNMEREFPFDSTVKRMSMVYKNSQDQSYVLFMKGAPERVLEACTHIVTDDLSHPEPLSEEHRTTISDLNKQMAGEGLRVLALAERTLDSPEGEREDVARDCAFIGLIGVRDPPRPGVPEAIQVCHRAGIAVHMVTGDHPFTAKAIASQIGILRPELDEAALDRLVMTASQFDKLTEEELHNITLPLVIARCSPDSKVRMVTELSRRGRKVAMLGDGVNDAPAIKLADVGVAMGLAGSDVTKEAADIVLMDDNFNTVVKAIEEGRRVFQNIRRFLIFLLTGNISQGLIIVLSIAFSLRTPLTPEEVLWVNLIVSAPPAFILGTVPGRAWYMDKHRRPVDEAFFTPTTILDILFYGILLTGLGIVNFVIAQYGFNQSLPRSQAACFAATTCMLMFHSYTCLNLNGLFFKGGFLRAKWLHACVIFGIGSLFFTFYTPPFEVHVFEHRRPDWRNWLVVIASVFVSMLFSELYKIVKKPFRARARRRDYEEQAAQDEYMIFPPREVEAARVAKEMKPMRTDLAGPANA
eukprot:TRINITY_DN58_c0_g1_i1.p1 TRINITY_DN58_c0_g1~~TRINITY_DN58_c0_g1_i1.p1  ORF type:complete len:1037 (-),score=258.51 TRINITY_DN58_c0_g1_i1:49-3111(-)